MIRTPPVTAITAPPAPAVAALPLRPTPVAWMAQAACQYTDPEVFYPLPGASLFPARRICHQCPVLGQCLQWALLTGESYGILGGASVTERRALAAVMRAWASSVGLPCPEDGPIPLEVQEAYQVANAVVAA